MNRKRLLSVARALRESPEAATFSMHVYGRGCGTPACALGHYAAREDLQERFQLRSANDRADEWAYVYDRKTGACVAYNSEVVMTHFDIGWFHADALFGVAGCGDAKTAKQAADYIEWWVAREKQP